MQATPLTWEQVFKFLAVRFGEDIAQETLLRYYKKFGDIQDAHTKFKHPLRYLSVMGKMEKLYQLRQQNRQKRKALAHSSHYSPPQSCPPSQIDRLLLLEVWSRLKGNPSDYLIGQTTPGKGLLGRKNQYSTSKTDRFQSRQQLLEYLEH